MSTPGLQMTSSTGSKCLNPPRTILGQDLCKLMPCSSNGITVQAHSMQLAQCNMPREISTRGLPATHTRAITVSSNLLRQLLDLMFSRNPVWSINLKTFRCQATTAEGSEL